jgi:uncharacterized protein YbjT (DUF2867 family)
VARVLIVGCGCRGQALAGALARDGLAVRGTSRGPGRAADIAAAGAEPADADPDRLGTLLPHLQGVAAVCWLLGSASGPSAGSLHGPRLATLLERLVDTPVRGLVYEAAGSADAAALRDGERLVRHAGARWRLPVRVVHASPDDHPAWLAAMRSAVSALLA